MRSRPLSRTGLAPASAVAGALAGGVFSLLVGCGDGDSNNNADFGSDVDVEAPVVPGFGGNNIAGGDPGDTNEPPEQERESTFRAPVVTGKYVWSANPSSGRVAVIDAESYEIRSADAGFLPTHVAAVNQPDGVPRALVINTGGSDATLLTLEPSGAIATLSVPLHQGADSWSVGPGGRFAIAWSDSRNTERLDPTDGFQDITVVELPEAGPPTATRLTVGYRPSDFVFASAGDRAFGITQDGISVIELGTGAVRLSRLVPLPSSARLQPDVSVLPNGLRALARLEGSPILFDIDLQTGVSSERDLGGVLTDLDLSENGAHAVAVIRNGRIEGGGSDPDAGSDAGGVGTDAGDAGDGGTGVPGGDIAASQAVFIPIPAGLSDVTQRRTLSSTAEAFGSVVVSSDGARAVLFTNARASGRVTLVGPELETRSLDLIAAVRAVFITADGSHAIALQDPPAGSVKKGAFSVLSLANVRAPKLVASDAPAEAVALLSTSSERALVTVSNPAQNSFGAFLVRMPSLQVDFSSLPSQPLSTGTVPSAGEIGKGFVAQAHPEGRITFIDLADGVGREITGFELSSKVVSE